MKAHVNQSGGEVCLRFKGRDWISMKRIQDVAELHMALQGYEVSHIRLSRRARGRGAGGTLTMFFRPVRGVELFKMEALEELHLDILMMAFPVDPSEVPGVQGPAPPTRPRRSRTSSA